MNNPLSELFFTILALIVVLGIAWLVLRGAKNLHNLKQKNNPMTLKSTLPLGSKERVVVIQYQGKEYLLGVTSHQINLLDKTLLGPDESTVTSSHGPMDISSHEPDTTNQHEPLSNGLTSGTERKS